jgi:Co/Zn/Cd efflux system component
MERTMKTIINGTAGLLIVLGLMAMAGSANDCDGACMETANTLGEMLVVASIGLAMTLFGGMILLMNGNEDA